jgi:hypothetical protein
MGKYVSHGSYFRPLERRKTELLTFFDRQKERDVDFYKDITKSFSKTLDNFFYCDIIVSG